MTAHGETLGEGSNRIDLTARLEEWRRLLLDTSKRNRLINSRFGRGGVLGLEHPEFYQLWEQFAVKSQPGEFPWPSQLIEINETDQGESDADDNPHPGDRGVLSATELRSIKENAALNPNNWLLTNLADRPLDGRLKRLGIAATTSLQEQGVNSLFLAFGFLRWFESVDSDTPILSPLVLLPVSLHKPSADSSWELAPVDDDLAPNHPLTELLRSNFRLTLPQFSEDKLSESSEALKSFFAEVEHAITGHERWEVQVTAGLGTFAFQKISMWQDLGKNREQILGHQLCRGIAGDDSLIPTKDVSDIFGSDLDQSVPPETSYLVRDCDSSQLAAMEVVRQGHHLILDGPPGTGKSQTITNIIARCLANNKTVLFVSEKAAALDVVKRRLDEVKLGDFCLECHSHKANKRAVVEELGRCLNRQQVTYPPQDEKITELRRTREKLNDYVRALHLRRSALNLTAYGVHGRLAKIRTSSVTRVAITDPHSIDQNRFQEMEEAVSLLANCGVIIATRGIHPWHGCRTELYNLTLPDDIRFHFDRAATARDRDRLRQDVLENLGWKICRIWSTDWIRDPRRQIEKVLDAYRRALADGDSYSPPTKEVVTLSPVMASNQSAARKIGSTPQFASIDNVPIQVQRGAIIDALESYGAMPLDDLLQAAARKLGFQRTGSNIRDRLSFQVQNLQRQGKLTSGSDGRLRLLNSTHPGP